MTPIADAFDKLFGTIARRRRVLLEGDRARLEISPGSSEIATAFKEENGGVAEERAASSGALGRATVALVGNR